MTRSFFMYVASVCRSSHMASCWWNCLLVKVYTQEQVGNIRQVRTLITYYITALTVGGFPASKGSLSQALAAHFSH